MIQMETKVKIVDNSGGVRAKCVKVYNKRFGLVGDKVIVSVIRTKKRKKIHALRIRKQVVTHQLYKGIIVNAKTGIKKCDGRTVVFNNNSIILLSRDKENIIGTRIFSPVLKEFRHKKYMRLLLISLRQL